VKRLVTAAVLASGLFGMAVGPLRAEVTAEQVRAAIDRGVNYLKSEQRDNGSWIDALGYEGGISALCTLALLNSGVDPGDERMQKALGHLRKIRPQKTYAIALQTMVFARAEPERDRLLIEGNVKLLERTQIREGPFRGAWGYPGGDGDNSNSQFALLALHEAERVGISASGSTWQLTRKYWENTQNGDGSWGYKQKGSPGTGSMTCAGVTSLVIAMDRVQAAGARVHGDRIECCVPRRASDADDADRIENGIRWLGQRYSVSHNPGNNAWLLYYLYGLERTGRLTARRFIPLFPAKPDRPNRADWYREGADGLVRRQDVVSGFWTGVGHAEDQPVIGTSFALLFLSKGRWPVLLGKLQYGPPQSDDWNSHRSDVANLTRYVETRWKRDLTWQVIDLRSATVEELLQTPVLYLCGSQSPLPDDPGQRKELAQKFRDYLDRGGFLFAEANCGSAAFNAGFRELMQQVFPEPEYKLQLLEPEHPIWYAEEKIDPGQVRPLWGVEFGCRTSVVYVPPEPPRDPRPSLSCLWELARPGRGQKYSRVVQAQIDAGLSLGINVLAYATNRELKTKEEVIFRPNAGGPSDRVERGRLSVATLRHPGGCNAAPRAIVNLMDAAGAQLKLRTHVREQLLDIGDEALMDYHLVFMHGRTAFHLTEAERRRLREYVERGGTILADSICASGAFSESFRREMAAVFPDRKLERIPTDDPLLSTTYGGSDLRIVSRRDPQAAPPGGGPLEATVRKVPPDLEGIKLGDRWGVVFSPFDLSCALEKRDSLACRGYTREDAARIGLNVVLYSLQQ
jgi:hypothetical protein